MADETTARLFDKLDDLKGDTGEIKERIAKLETAEGFRMQCDLDTKKRMESVEERVDILEKDKAAVLGIKWLIPILAACGLSFLNFLMELRSR